VAAAHFAGATLEAYSAEHPSEYAALLAGQFSFSVRIDRMLTPEPRVSLVTCLQRSESGGKMFSCEVEVAHAGLSAPGPRGATLN